MKSRLAAATSLPEPSPSTSASVFPPADAVEAALGELARLWNLGIAPNLDALWARFSPDRDVELLAALIKADLKIRFARGERPEVASYLARFAPLRDARDRVVSLVYEEYCLREEAGEAPEAESFCARYDAWRDSLLSQLRYHVLLSQAIGAVPRNRPLPDPGDRFRSFRLGAILGQGGSARVFLANDESLGDRPVALKVSTDRGNEPTIQGRLDHAHIVPVLSVTDDPETGLRGLCMPYRAGLSLDRVIRLIDPASRPEKATALREVLAVVEPAAPEEPGGTGWREFPEGGTYPDGVAWVVSIIADALAYAHARGVYHRDVKPANVLLTGRDGPQLLDFNLSHSPHAADRAEAALRGGTLPYMAPEQLLAFLDPEGWDDVDEKADVYSLGLVLRELLTGRRPESPDDSTPLPRAIRELLDRRVIGFGSARALNPDVPHGLDAILARCLSYRPQERYSGARALAEDLRRHVRKLPLKEAVNPSRRERIGNWVRRNRPYRLLALVPALALLVGPWFFLGNGGKARELAELAKELNKKGEYKDALKEANRAVAMDPRNHFVYWVRGNLLGGHREFGPALDNLETALRLARATPEVTPDKVAAILADRATLRFSSDRLEEAEADYREALATYADLASIHLGLGRIAMSRAKPDVARGHFQRAKELTTKPETREIQFLSTRLRAEASAEEGRLALLIDELGPALSHYESARADLADARQLAEGLDLTRNEAELLPKDEVIVYMGLGDVEFDRKNYREARAHWEAAAAALIQARTVNPMLRGLQKFQVGLDTRMKAVNEKLTR